MDSEFFNGLFAWNVERNRFFPLTLRKPRAQKKAVNNEERVGRRGRAQAKEEELLRQLAALETGKTLDEADEIELDRGGAEDGKNGDEEDDDKPMREMPVSMELPHPRFNAQLAVQDDVLYIYGGTFEKGDREFTFDDMYAIDLGKMDGCKEIWSRQTEDWIVSVHLVVGLLALFRKTNLVDTQESEDEEDDEEDEDEDMDDEEEEEEEEGDVDMDDEDQSKSTPSKRKNKQDAETEASQTSSTAASEEEESEADTTATSVDDGLPHPRVSFLSAFFFFFFPFFFLYSHMFLPSQQLTV